MPNPCQKRYPSDLSPNELAILIPLLPPPKATGRKPSHSWPDILNGMFYILVAGCSWRMLPKDFPPWKTVYHDFRLWSLDGTLDQLYAALRERVRLKAGRNSKLSALIVDSQSVKTGKKGDLVAMMPPKK
jgi:putative transposase